MTYLERLVATGMSRECALDAVAWYTFQGDDRELETYVNAVESAHRYVETLQLKPDRKECR